MSRVRTDHGGKLAKSSAVRSLLAKHRYILETTGSDASFQNAIAKRPHRTHGNTMRNMLDGVGLSNKYWSAALNHAIYLKNRLPRRAITTMPFGAYTGAVLDLLHPRVFGGRVTSKHPGDRKTKVS